MLSQKIAFCCTTINPNSSILSENIKIWRTSINDRVFISLDRKNENEDQFINYRRNHKTDFERMLPFDSYTRKNIAYLDAIQDGCNYIFETDDDNLILDQSVINPSVFDNRDLNFANGNLFENIYDCQSNIWARGYPLEFLHCSAPLREETTLYPEIALRELVANAIIHQDMTVTGAGPQIEMFSDRIEITNPGEPLVDPDRFLDLPPRSRNEALASAMRRMGFCEEQGSGVDKVLFAVELHQMPAPDFRHEHDSVKVILYAPRRFADMTPSERIRACYLHAALKWVNGGRMKNATLCERFGINSKNAAQASNVIRQTLEEGLIKHADPEHPRAGYLPFWA